MSEPIKGRISRKALQERLNGSASLLQAVKPGIYTGACLPLPQLSAAEVPPGG